MELSSHDIFICIKRYFHFTDVHIVRVGVFHCSKNVLQIKMQVMKFRYNVREVSFCVRKVLEIIEEDCQIT